MFAFALALFASLAAAPYSLVVQTGHSLVVESVQLSADGRTLVTAGADHTARLWDLASAKEYRTFSGHSGSLVGARLTPDGRTLVTASYDQTVKVWDAESGRLLHTLPQGSPVRGLALSPDGRLACVGTRAGDVLLWEVQTGQKLHANVFGNWNYRGIRYQGVEKADAVVFTPDGKRCLAGGMPATVAQFDVATGKLVDLSILRSASGEAELGNISRLALTPDGRYLAAGFDSFSQDAVVLDLQRGSNVLRVPHASSVKSVAFSPDGKTLVTGSKERGRQIFRFFDLPGGKEREPLRGGDVDAYEISYSKDGAVFAVASDPITLHDSATGRTVASLGTRAFPLLALTGDPWGRGFTTLGSDWSVRTWDFNSARQVSRLQLEGKHRQMAVSPDGTLLAAVRYTDNAQTTELWDLKAGKLLRLLEGHATRIEALAFSRDNKLLATGDADGVLLQWEVATGKQLTSAHEGARGIQALAYSPNGKALAVAWRDSVRLYVPGTDKSRTTLAFPGALATVFSPSGRFLALSGGDNISGTAPPTAIRVLDLKLMKEVSRLQGHELGVQAMAFSPDEKTLVTGSGALMKNELQSVRVWEVQTGKQLGAFAGHQGHIYGMAFAADGEHFASGSFDGTVRVWSVSKGPLLTLAAGGDDWIAFDGQGRFDASPGGGALVAIARGAEVFSVDQFATRLNRPDLMLQDAGLGTPEMIAHYRSMFERRLKKLGLREADLGAELQIPQATISSVTETGGGQSALLEVKLRDANRDLKSWSVFVNDVPLFGGAGRPISGREQALTETIPLTAGPNKIEVSCTSDRGVESYRALRVVNGVDRSKPNLYYLGFGVSKYRDSKLDLGFAHKDAQDLAAAFSALEGKGFGKVFAKAYLNEEVTPAAIRAAKAFVKEARPEDVFVLFIAGHGIHDSDPAATYYFLTHGAELTDLKSTAADFESIEDLLQGIGPRRKLFLMDTCESGEAEPSVDPSAQASADVRAMQPRTARGIKKIGSGKRAFVLQKDRYVYNDLSRRSGAIVFSSSRGGELSYERAELQNGLFTSALLKALRTGAADADGDGQVSTDELRSYVTRQVAEQSGDLQHPTVDRDNLSLRFGFPVVK